MATCPVFTDKTVKNQFNKIVSQFGGEKLSEEEFAFRGVRNARSGIDALAMNVAYFLWDAYNGDFDRIQESAVYKYASTITYVLLGNTTANKAIKNFRDSIEGLTSKEYSEINSFFGKFYKVLSNISIGKNTIDIMQMQEVADSLAHIIVGQSIQSNRPIKEVAAEVLGKFAQSLRNKYISYAEKLGVKTELHLYDEFEKIETGLTKEEYNTGVEEELESVLLRMGDKYSSVIGEFKALLLSDDINPDSAEFKELHKAYKEHISDRITVNSLLKEVNSVRVALGDRLTALKLNDLYKKQIKKYKGALEKLLSGDGKLKRKLEQGDITAAYLVEVLAPMFNNLKLLESLTSFAVYKYANFSGLDYNTDTEFGIFSISSLAQELDDVNKVDTEDGQLDLGYSDEVLDYDKSSFEKGAPISKITKQFFIGLPIGNEAVNILGMKMFIDPAAAAAVVRSILRNSTGNLNDMIGRLQKFQDKYSWLSVLIDRLEKAPAQAKEAFRNNMNAVYVNQYMVFFDLKGNTSVVYRANDASAINSLYDNWVSNLEKSNIADENGYVNLEQLAKNLEVISGKVTKNWNDSVIDELHDFFNSIGIEISRDTLTSKSTDKDNQLFARKLLKELSYKIDRLKKNNNEAKALFSDFYEVYKGKVFRALASLEIRNNPSLMPLSHKVGKKTLYSYTWHSFLSVLNSKLNSDENLVNKLLEAPYRQNSPWLRLIKDKLNKREELSEYVPVINISAFTNQVVKRFGGNENEDLKVGELHESERELLITSLMLKPVVDEITGEERIIFSMPITSDKGTYYTIEAPKFSNILEVNSSGSVVISEQAIEDLIDYAVMPEVERMNKLIQMELRGEEIPEEYRIGGHLFHLVPKLNLQKELFDKDGYIIEDENKIREIAKAVLIREIEHEVSERVRRYKTFNIKATFDNVTIESAFGKEVADAARKNEEALLKAVARYVTMQSRLGYSAIYTTFLPDIATTYKDKYFKEAISHVVEKLSNEVPNFNKDDYTQLQLMRMVSKEDLTFAITAIRNNYNKRAAMFIASGRMGENSGTVNYLVANDRKVASKMVEQLKVILGEKYADYTEKGQLKESTNAQEFITLREYIRNLYFDGQISEDLFTTVMDFFETNSGENYREDYEQDLYKALEEKGVLEEYNNLIVNPMKPVYNWLQTDDITGIKPIYVKSSAYPLLPSMKSLEINKVRALLERNGFDRLTFPSAVKLGVPQKPIELWDKDGNIREDFTPDELEPAALRVDRIGLRIQQDVPFHGLKYVINKSTQAEKNLFTDLLNIRKIVYKGKEYNGKDLHTHYLMLQEKLYGLLTDRLCEDLGIEGFKQWNSRQQQVSELFESNPTLANAVYEALGFGKESNLSEKNIFTVEPIQSVDKKAKAKAKIATQFIGFAEGIEGSSTALYAKQITKQSNNIKPKANIPQNLVSGVESFGTKQEANTIAKKLLGDAPHSIDMIEAGIRTRTTRSAREMQKYNVKVGDIVMQFGKSADGTNKQILTRITAIHPKGTPEFFSTWEKEGWTPDGVEAIKRFKDGAAVIEFEVIKSNIVNSGNYSSNDVIFVSIVGKRGDETVRRQQQDKTIKEAIKALEAGATLITDNAAYVESNSYNEGEKRLAANLKAKGYNYSEITVDGHLLGVWNKNTNQQKQQAQQLYSSYLQTTNNPTVERNGNNVVTSINKEKLRDLLVEEGKKRGFSPVELAIISDLDYLSLLPLTPSASIKTEALFNALVKNRIIKIKYPGNSYVLSTEEGFQTKKTATLEEIDKDEVYYTDSFTGELDPGSYVDADGNVLTGKALEEAFKNDTAIVKRPSQVLIPWRFVINGKSVGVESFLKEENGKKMIDMSRVDPEILKMIGLRIPNAGLNSMAAIEIVGFLPEKYGDLVVASRDFLAQMGSDFDVDKLYSYGNTVFVTSDEEGNPKLVKLTEETKDLYINELSEVRNYLTQLKKSRDSEEGPAMTSFMSLFINDLSEVNDLFKEINIRIVQNEITDIFKTILTTPNRIIALKNLTPTSYGKFSDIAAQAAKEQVNPAIGLYSLISDEYHRRTIEKVNMGKELISIYAAFNPQLSMFQHTKFSVGTVSDESILLSLPDELLGVYEGVFTLDADNKVYLVPKLDGYITTGEMYNSLTLEAQDKLRAAVAKKIGFNKYSEQVTEYISINFEAALDLLDKEDIVFRSDILNGQVQGAVDNAKEDILGTLNINLDNVNNAIALTLLGYSEDVIGHFFRIPVVKQVFDYIKESSSALLENKDYSKSTVTAAVKTVINELIQTYGVKEVTNAFEQLLKRPDVKQKSSGNRSFIHLSNLSVDTMKALINNGQNSTTNQWMDKEDLSNSLNALLQLCVINQMAQTATSVSNALRYDTKELGVSQLDLLNNIKQFYDVYANEKYPAFKETPFIQVSAARHGFYALRVLYYSFYQSKFDPIEFLGSLMNYSYWNKKGLLVYNETTLNYITNATLALVGNRLIQQYYPEFTTEDKLVSNLDVLTKLGALSGQYSVIEKTKKLKGAFPENFFLSSLISVKLTDNAYGLKIKRITHNLEKEVVNGILELYNHDEVIPEIGMSGKDFIRDVAILAMIQGDQAMFNNIFKFIMPSILEDIGVTKVLESLNGENTTLSATEKVSIANQLVQRVPKLAHSPNLYNFKNANKEEASNGYTHTAYVSGDYDLKPGRIIQHTVQQTVKKGGETKIKDVTKLFFIQDYNQDTGFLGLVEIDRIYDNKDNTLIDPALLYVGNKMIKPKPANPWYGTAAYDLSPIRGQRVYTNPLSNLDYVNKKITQLATQTSSQQEDVALESSDSSVKEVIMETPLTRVVQFLSAYTNANFELTEYLKVLSYIEEFNNTEFILNLMNQISLTRGSYQYSDRSVKIMYNRTKTALERQRVLNSILGTFTHELRHKEGHLLILVAKKYDSVNESESFLAAKAYELLQFKHQLFEGYRDVIGFLVGNRLLQQYIELMDKYFKIENDVNSTKEQKDEVSREVNKFAEDNHINSRLWDMLYSAYSFHEFEANLMVKKEVTEIVQMLINEKYNTEETNPYLSFAENPQQAFKSLNSGIVYAYTKKYGKDLGIFSMLYMTKLGLNIIAKAEKMDIFADAPVESFDAIASSGTLNYEIYGTPTENRIPTPDEIRKQFGELTKDGKPKLLAVDTNGSSKNYLIMQQRAIRINKGQPYYDVRVVKTHGEGTLRSKEFYTLAFFPRTRVTQELVDSISQEEIEERKKFCGY